MATMNEFQRDVLALFAAKEAGPGASADQMKAIAMCIRNRVRQGWHGGDWMQIMEHHNDVRGNDEFEWAELSIEDRNLQILVRDIDEIFFSRRDWEKDPSRERMPGLDEGIGDATYWAFINYPFTEWFRAHILHDHQNHKLKAQMGLMVFYT